MFEEMDSTLAVQQYIQQLIRKDFTAVDDILKAPDSQDEGVWKYEHLRLEITSQLYQKSLQFKPSYVCVLQAILYGAEWDCC